MGWDPSRPVPWRRMIREWLMYVAIMLVVLLIFFRDRPLIGIVAGLLVSGPLYLGIGYVLAKFGYQRKSWSELRDRSEPSTATVPVDTPAGPRPKPAPTSRTGGSRSRPPNKRR